MPEPEQQVIDKRRARRASYRAKNREKLLAQMREWGRQNRERVKANNRRRYLAKRQERIAAAIRYRARNLETILARQRQPEVRARQNERRRARHAANPQMYRDRLRLRPTTPQKKIAKNVRIRVSKAIRRHQNGAKVWSSVRYLDCTIEQFIAHVESLWHGAMSWENYGFRGWHLDHIRPLASFDLTDQAQFSVAFRYTNYQPLWWRDNLSKGARLY